MKNQTTLKYKTSAVALLVQTLMWDGKSDSSSMTDEVFEEYMKDRGKATGLLKKLTKKDLEFLYDMNWKYVKSNKEVA